MATSTTNLSVQIVGPGFSYTYTPPTSAFSNNSAPDAVPVSVTLAGGANTIAIPTGAQGALIVPNAGSANTKTLKGVTGDTGVGLAPALPSLVMFAAGVTNIVITSGGNETVQVAWL